MKHATHNLPSAKSFFASVQVDGVKQDQACQQHCPCAKGELGGAAGLSTVLLGWAFKLQPTKKCLELGHGDDFSG